MTLAIIFDSVGVGEWFVLLAVVLIVVGPKRLPATARKLGAYYSKFRRAADSFKRQLLDMDTEFTNTVRDAANEVKDAVADFDRDLSAPVDANFCSRQNEDGSSFDGRDQTIASTDGRDQTIASTDGRDQKITSATPNVPQDQQS